MDFRFTFTLLGDVEKELVPAGEDVVVTLENRAEFCQLAREAMMSQFDTQIELIRSGLDDYTIPTVAFMLWTTQEFQEQVRKSAHTCDPPTVVWCEGGWISRDLNGGA